MLGTGILESSLIEKRVLEGTPTMLLKCGLVGFNVYNNRYQWLNVFSNFITPAGTANSLTEIPNRFGPTRYSSRRTRQFIQKRSC
uniref:Uncharacterized protein n=1 Tax=Pararge aegeria TaxID=116150 RepID=S4PG72_9NEOP